MIKKCDLCGLEFEEKYKSSKRKFCSRKCSDAGRNKDNTLKGDAWYIAMEGVDLGKTFRGKKNINLSKTKRRQSKEVTLVIWNKGLIDVQPKLLGKEHPGIKKRMERSGLTWEEYNNWKDDKDRYYKEVWRITNQQPLHILLNFDKPRGRSGINGAYQLDHIISIGEGYRNNINPDIVGNIVNLQFITWEDNLKRRKFNYE
jgi:hypothetical protein